jgi:hypothetical protein
MMRVTALIAGLRVHGLAAGVAAVDRAGDAIVAAARAELPGVAAVNDRGIVTLTAPGLRARAFGTRHHAADPRVTGLVATRASGRDTP